MGHIFEAVQGSPHDVNQRRYRSLFKRHDFKDHNGWFCPTILEKRSAIYTALMPLSTLILIYDSNLEEMLFARSQQYLHIIDILTGYHFIKTRKPPAIHIAATLLN